MKGRTFPSTFNLPRREKKQPTSTQYSNPIALAQEWHRSLDDGEAASKTNLARILKVLRAQLLKSYCFSPWLPWLRTWYSPPVTPYKVGFGVFICIDGCATFMPRSHSAGSEKC